MIFSHIFEPCLEVSWQTYPGLIHVREGGLKISDITDAHFRCGHEVHYQDDTWHGMGWSRIGEANSFQLPELGKSMENWS